MTVTELLALYLPRRQALLRQGVAVDGWRVHVHPQDALDLEREILTHAGEHIAIDGQFVYGATWVSDATVPRGNIRIETTGAR
jgi:hypothetical protein